MVVPFRLLVVSSIALFVLSGASFVVPGVSSAAPNDVVAWPAVLGPQESTAAYVDPALMDAAGPQRILVAVDDMSANRVAMGMRASQVTPSLGSFRLVAGTVDAASAAELARLPGVRAILLDRPINRESRPSGVVLPNRLGFPGHAPSSLSNPARSPLLGDAEILMRDVVNFTGARRAWTQLGADGTDVTIAVVDTGVDHGAFALGESSVARDAAGLPSSFDPDGGVLAYTTLRVTSFTSGSSLRIRTRGTDPQIYLFDLAAAFGPYGPATLAWSDPRLPFGSAFPEDMDITGIQASRSGTYHFGVLGEWHYVPPLLYLDMFPVVVVDTTTSGVYDTVYIDLSFNWFLLGFSARADFSFSDERPLKPTGDVVASRDMDGDGYPDISAGSLAHYLDIWQLSPSVADRGRVLKPVDPAGDYIAMVYDWFGHGTQVASGAAGRETGHGFAGPGIAKGARIMGIPVFYWFDIVAAWFWAAGFDLVAPSPDPGGEVLPSLIASYGEWRYTGNHRADVISNSWGSSESLRYARFFGWPWYDLLTVLEDLLASPGYADPAYPGSVMVHAAGNGAAGYGTVTEPGWSNLAITAGASTSMNWTRFPTPGFGTAGGYHGDVMSWSARGPTPLGAPKPDVVHVGAFAWTSAPVWSGGGSGADAYTLFGGTSLATPLTAGSAAVVIQAYREARGTLPSPQLVKAILKSSAQDLGYDPFVQGAGQVDVFRSASLAKGTAGLLVTTPATWDNVRPSIAYAWSAASAFFPSAVPPAPPSGSIEDASWFAGSVRPAGTTTATFRVASATGTASGTLQAVWHERIGMRSFSGTTRSIAGWLEGHGDVVSLQRSDIPADADLMVVRGSMPFTAFDANGDNAWDHRGRIIVADWVDVNNDGQPAPTEAFVINYGYNAGTTFESRVGFPASRFQGRPLLWFSQAPAAAFQAISYGIQVEFYKRVPWLWVSVPTSFTASSAGTTFDAVMAVPAGTHQGVYEGQILVATSGRTTAIPVSVVVPAVMDGSALSLPMTPAAASASLYDPHSVKGFFDWRWRYEAGDWRAWFADLRDPNAIAIRLNVSWTDPRADVDLWSVFPSGLLGDASNSSYLDNGTFLWETRSGTTWDFLTVDPTSGFDRTQTGIYTFLLHNVLRDGLATPLALSGTLELARLSPRGPIQVETQPGRTVSIPLTLSSGFGLSNVFFVPAAPPFGADFVANTEPFFTPSLARGASLALWANISVPANAADGTYKDLFILAANQLPGTIVRVDIIVDSTSPTVTVLSPTGGYVRGALPVEARVVESNTLSDVSFTAGALNGTMSFDTVSGLWRGTWDTTGAPDGAQPVRVTATDASGNAAVASIQVAVDNTRPTVAIAAPGSGAVVRGIVNVAFSASDANLEDAWLVINGVRTTVTGTSSFAWDTRGLPDGEQNLTLIARDRAGNENSVTVRVRTDSVGGVIAEARSLGLILGAIIGMIVGLFVGFLFARRKKREPAFVAPTMQVPPPPPSPPSGGPPESGGPPPGGG